MNKIQNAYEQGLRVRNSYWTKKYWVKKHSEKHSIDESGDFWVNDWKFVEDLNNWEIWHEDEHLFNQPDTIVQAVQSDLQSVAKGELLSTAQP